MAFPESCLYHKKKPGSNQAFRYRGDPHPSSPKTLPPTSIGFGRTGTAPTLFA